MKNAAESIRAFSLPHEAVALFWLGNSGFAMKFGNGTVAYIDPLLSDCVYRVNRWQRLFPALFSPQEADCDLLFITHGHADHLDPDSIGEVTARTRGPVVAPPSCITRMKDMGVPPDSLRPIHPGEVFTSSEISVRAVRAFHMHPKNPQPDAVGLVFTYAGMNIYHAGDTAYMADVRDSVAACTPLRAALLPISGKRCCLTTEDAAFFAGDLSPDLVVPMHYGIFAENSADPSELLMYMQRYGVKSKLQVLPVGGGLVLEPSGMQLTGV